MLLKKALDTLKIPAKSTVCSSLSEHEELTAISYPGNRKDFYPDLVIRVGEKEDIYAVEPRYSKAVLSESLAKWILFSTEAKKTGGTFYLIAPKKLQKDFEECFEKRGIKAEIIAIGD